MSRILAIDYGQARVGLAVTDPDGRVVFPLSIIHWETRQTLFDTLLGIIREQGIERIVVGYPRRAGGNEGLTGRQVRNFTERLRRRITLPIVLVDEAHSTEEAAEQLQQAGCRGRDLPERLDAQAAAVILERYLRDGELCFAPSSLDS